MTINSSADPGTYVATAESLVERVFGAVGALRRQVLACRATAMMRREQLQSKHIAQLRPGLISVLDEHRDIVVGMGLIVVPGLLPNERRRLEWWQYLPGRDEPSALRVDLNPESLGFYDYDNSEWFSIPRTTGRRHIMGPYVDAHGTDRYLLTFTVPVLADGAFLGVVGADVPVARLERHLLKAWAVQGAGQLKNSTGEQVEEVGAEVMIINSQGRVVVSNYARALSGDLVPIDACPPSSLRVELTDVPWRLQFALPGEARRPN